MEVNMRCFWGLCDRQIFCAREYLPECSFRCECSMVKDLLREVELQLGGGKELEGETVVGSGAETAYGITVGCRGIPLVLVPVICRKLLVQSCHIVVPISFCKNGRSGNGHHFAVALDNCLMWHGNAGGGFMIGVETVAVHENEFGACFQLVESTVHREY